MKKGFTLIELLITVTVIVVLMGIVFRLSDAGGSSRAKARTIQRIQCLENACSGYYAVFGSYPPVPLHGERDYALVVNSKGIQDSKNRSENWPTKDDTTSSTFVQMRDQVNAACRSQPLGAAFPFEPVMGGYIREYSDVYKKRLEEGVYSNLSAERRRAIEAGFDDGGFSSGSFGRFRRVADKGSWNQCQMFQFGLMSYLLPRYLFMLNFARDLNGQFDLADYAQWTANNTLPAKMWENGQPYENWAEVVQDVGSDRRGGHPDRWRLELIASQAACARWMPNLKGIVRVSFKDKFELFGVNVCERTDLVGSEGMPNANDLKLFTPQGDSSNDSTSDQYLLDSLTVYDGWNKELFYYSPPPYQSFRIWSAGPNGCTFPPWISLDKLSGAAKETVAEWISDDITGLAN